MSQDRIPFVMPGPAYDPDPTSRDTSRAYTFAGAFHIQGESETWAMDNFNEMRQAYLLRHGFVDATAGDSSVANTTSNASS